MELRLVKVTEGVPGKEGAVMYHSFGAFSILTRILRFVCALLCFHYDSKKVESGSQRTEKGAR